MNFYHKDSCLRMSFILTDIGDVHALGVLSVGGHFIYLDTGVLKMG